MARQVDSVGVTGLWVAGLRALEAERPDPAFVDPYAADLCGSEIGNARRLTGDVPGYELNPVLLRTRVGDKVLMDAVARGVRQAVLLGAGMDTRAYRLPVPGDLTVWEIDRAAPLEYKESILNAAGASAGCRRVRVVADLAEGWDRKLLRSGFDPGLPTVWLVEGLWLYLDAATSDFVARTLTCHSAPTSELVFDAYSREAFDEPEFSGWRAAFAERGTILGSSMADPEGWIGRFGWQARAYDRADVLEGRCPWAAPEPKRIAESFLSYSWMVHATLA